MPRHTSSISAVRHDAKRTAGRNVLWILFTVGLAIRLAGIGLEGTNDMQVVLGWGDGVRKFGLVQEYHGIYYPLEYLLFAGASWSRDSLGVSGFISLKSLTLICDIGAFLCMVQLLSAWGLDERFALIYWLHPFFLSAFELGYLDAHLALCVLATLVLMLRPTPARTLAAGIPLGLGVLTKPQMIPIVGMTIVLGLALAAMTRSREPLFTTFRLLVVPALLIAGVSVYFALDGAHLTTLAASYSPRTLAAESPGLTGNMLNVWYPVAAAAREGSQPIYAVAKPDAANALGTLMGGALLLVGVYLVARRHEAFTAVALLQTYALTATVVPLVMTHAHENHFFLAGTLGVLVAARSGDRRLTWLLSVLLAIQFVNLFFRYGLGLTELTQTDWISALKRAYVSHIGLQVALAVAMIVLAVPWFVQILRPATSSIWPARGRTGSRR